MTIICPSQLPTPPLINLLAPQTHKIEGYFKADINHLKEPEIETLRAIYKKLKDLPVEERTEVKKEIFDET